MFGTAVNQWLTPSPIPDRQNDAYSTYVSKYQANYAKAGGVVGHGKSAVTQLQAASKDTNPGRNGRGQDVVQQNKINTIFFFECWK